MKDIILFLKNNWQIIAAVVLFVLSFILQLIKKKPIKVIDSIAQYIQNIACETINQVESMANGKKYIDYEGFITPKIDVAVSLISKRLALIFPGVDISQYLIIIRTIIEKILSTPQKHENK